MLAALLPLSLHDAIRRLPALTARLEAPLNAPPRQLELFRARLRENDQLRRPLNC